MWYLTILEYCEEQTTRSKRIVLSSNYIVLTVKISACRKRTFYCSLGFLDASVIQMLYLLVSVFSIFFPQESDASNKAISLQTQQKNIRNQWFLFDKVIKVFFPSQGILAEEIQLFV